jgi:hypothetical protein
LPDALGHRTGIEGLPSWQPFLFSAPEFASLPDKDACRELCSPPPRSSTNPLGHDLSLKARIFAGNNP